jgi:hypothetical protein
LAFWVFFHLYSWHWFAWISSCWIFGLGSCSRVYFLIRTGVIKENTWVDWIFEYLDWSVFILVSLEGFFSKLTSNLYWVANEWTGDSAMVGGWVDFSGRNSCRHPAEIGFYYLHVKESERERPVAANQPNNKAWCGAVYIPTYDLWKTLYNIKDLLWVLVLIKTTLPPAFRLATLLTSKAWFCIWVDRFGHSGPLFRKLNSGNNFMKEFNNGFIACL